MRVNWLIWSIRWISQHIVVYHIKSLIFLFYLLSLLSLFLHLVITIFT